jgi:hypothetical protein
VFQIRKYFLRIRIRGSLLLNYVPYPNPGGQLITDPGPCPTLKYFWPLNRKCCQIGTVPVVPKLLNFGKYLTFYSNFFGSFLINTRIRVFLTGPVPDPWIGNPVLRIWIRIQEANKLWIHRIRTTGYLLNGYLLNGYVLSIDSGRIRTTATRH